MNEDLLPYDVALSFAGEDRVMARQLAHMLRDQGLLVFYDEFEQAELLGKSLTRHLHSVYTRQARFCVPIISKAYVGKAYPRHELQSALSRAIKEKREYILPLRLDDSPIDGLPDDIVYLDFRHMSLAQVVSVLVRKVKEDTKGATNLKEPDRSEPRFLVPAVKAPLSADLVLFGNESDLVVLVNDRGVLISRDMCRSAELFLADLAVGKIRQVALSHDDQYLAVLGESDLAVAELATGKINLLSNFLDDGATFFNRSVIAWDSELRHLAVIVSEKAEHEFRYVTVITPVADGLQKVVDVGRGRCLLPKATKVMWSPGGGLIGIVGGGGGKASFWVFRHNGEFIGSLHGGMADGSNYFWLTIHHILRVSGGAAAYSLSVHDIRTSKERLIWSIGDYPIPIPAPGGSAVVIGSKPSTGLVKWLMALIRRPVILPLFEIEASSAVSAAWSSSLDKLAVSINGQLYLVELPAFF